MERRPPTSNPTTRRAWIASSLLLTALGTGCAHTAAPPGKLAVLPLDGVGIGKEGVGEMRRAISRQLQQVSGAEVVERDQVDFKASVACGASPVPQDKWEDCASKVGRSLGASHVVAGAVGGLANTYVLHLKLVEVSRGASIRSLEETLFRQRKGRQAAVEAIARRLLNIHPTPWYKRWWIWTSLAVVAAAAVIVPLSLEEDDPYRNIPVP